MDLRSISNVTDFFVLCTADNTRHLGALKEHIEAALDQQGGSVWHIEGVASGGRPSTSLQPEPQWILMDCGDLVIHLFDRPARAFYRLEDLWADAQKLPLESLSSASSSAPEVPKEAPRPPFSSPPR